MEEILKNLLHEHPASKVVEVLTQLIFEKGRVHSGVSMNGLRKRLCRNYDNLVDSFNSFYKENYADFYNNQRFDLKDIGEKINELSDQINGLNCIKNDMFSEFDWLEINLEEIDFLKEDDE
jgi:hypothetical protein